MNKISFLNKNTYFKIKILINKYLYIVYLEINLIEISSIDNR